MFKVNKQSFVAERLRLRTGEMVNCFGCYIHKTLVVELHKSSESGKETLFSKFKI